MSGRLLLGFDFVGAGNIGDDLMVEGFRLAITSLGIDRELVGCCAWDIESQRRRFPGIRWLRPSEFGVACVERRAGDVWVGAGGTPFQHSVGSWFLDWLEGHRGQIEACERRVLVGVGAESELGGAEGRFREIGDLFDVIVARDGHSARVLTEAVGIEARRVRVGADLANVALAGLRDGIGGTASFDLGLMPVADRGEREQHVALARFIERFDGSVAFVAGDGRELPGLETSLAAGAIEELQAGVAPPQVVTAPYADGSLAALIEHVGRCGALISWRYHGLLIGAWLGKRVAAVGRSSKVRALAEELGVAWRPGPIDAAGLRELAGAAHPVGGGTLQLLGKRAVAGVATAFGGAPGRRASISAVGPRLAQLEEMRSAAFAGLMDVLNEFAGAHGLRQFDTWSKIWEYPWIWHHALDLVSWPGTRLVDIGAELSPMPWLLATLGAKVTLIETDGQYAGLWTRLRDALGVEVDWHIVSDETLPLESTNADVVTSFSVIEHQPDKRRAIDEVARVLRPGGVFALSFDICEAEMGMTFPAWNGAALTMREFDEVVRGHRAFDATHARWNVEDIEPFLTWHRTTAPHHNYVTGAAVLIRRV